MEALANLVIAAVELIEAEARSFERQMVRLGLGAAVAVLAVLVGMAGLAFVLLSVYDVLELALPRWLAALIFGLCALMLSGAALWSARKIMG